MRCIKGLRRINVMKTHLGQQRIEEREAKSLSKYIRELVFGGNMESAQNT
jgi:hypothetical protein